MTNPNPFETQVTEALNQGEQSRIALLLSQQSQALELTVPANQDPDLLWENLTLCCRALGRMEKVISIMKPLVGRMLAILRTYPLEFWELKGFASILVDVEHREHGKFYGIAKNPCLAIGIIPDQSADVEPWNWRDIIPPSR